MSNPSHSSVPLTASEVIRALNLEALEPEGGYYRRIFESRESISTDRGERRIGTSIYYLVTPESPSKFHSVKCTEIYHYYLGDPLTLVLLAQDGSTRRVVLGPDLRAGQVPVWVIEPGVIQGSFIDRPESGFSLVGATCFPGFEFADFTLVDRALLLEKYPGERDAIERLG